MLLKGFPGGSVVKNSPANAGDTRDVGLIPGLGKSPEKEMATCSSIPAWRIARTEEPGRHTGNILLRVEDLYVSDPVSMSKLERILI